MKSEKKRRQNGDIRLFGVDASPTAIVKWNVNSAKCPSRGLRSGRPTSNCLGATVRPRLANRHSVCFAERKVELMRPRLLDLFCCAGGAAMGYHRAGFDVIGVDIVPRPSYPFAFIQTDALTMDPKFLDLFDVIHASPPCQSYSDLAHRNGNGHKWPQLVEPVREMLAATGKLTIIENVEGAPLRDPVVLCGTMFPELRVIRHRLFEVNFPLVAPAHGKHPRVHTLDKRKNHYGKTCEWKDYVQVTGGGNCSIASARDAMGIDWMSKKEINESIPPAYAQYVGEGAMRVLRSRKAA